MLPTRQQTGNHDDSGDEPSHAGVLGADNVLCGDDGYRREEDDVRAEGCRKLKHDVPPFGYQQDDGVPKRSTYEDRLDPWSMHRPDEDVVK